ncbi:acyl-CoA thioesterase [Qipengyuania sp. MTN3-11]|uniref:acyl-CoA thioesterase n=1 Tax=Qipengyuania sp. MTN3-11 TaxID=3056557 RepID=UPI0036F21C55
MSDRYARRFVAEADTIDELGHVNNAVWVRWVQDIATEHWRAVAAPQFVDAYVWVVIRHEIDYRGNVGPGEEVVATTWIPGVPKGARFDRCVEFHDAAGRLLVAVRSTWAMIDRATQRPQRIRAKIAAPFVSADQAAD